MKRLITSSKEETLKNSIIRKLMGNDHNGTWDECKNLKELKEGLETSVENYSNEKDEDEYIFYKSLLDKIEDFYKE